ncbi:hypothetical protein BJX66DRAFT_308921 [Aspergillus keveii]|uniref:Uncharacterized protein n=1 Tax=Aspergillus keveii TaxID=714993 RepID=A0ABR4FYK6_9EURO
MEKRVLDDRETTSIYAREVHTTGSAMNVAGGEQKCNSGKPFFSGCLNRGISRVYSATEDQQGTAPKSLFISWGHRLACWNRFCSTHDTLFQTRKPVCNQQAAHA